MPFWTEDEYHGFTECRYCRKEKEEACDYDAALYSELRKMSPYERRQIMALENISYYLEELKNSVDDLGVSIYEKLDDIEKKME